jgi:hypothetical protein
MVHGRLAGESARYPGWHVRLASRELGGRARLALMKEDVLEQIVDDYLQMQGYFTTHNVRFNPPRDQYYVSQTE